MTSSCGFGENKCCHHGDVVRALKLLEVIYVYQNESHSQLIKY